MTKPKRKRGRPISRIMPDPIPDTPGNVARSIMRGPPKRDWRFLQPGGAGYADGEPPTRRSPNKAENDQ